MSGFIECVACPFCGNTDIRLTRSDVIESNRTFYYMICNNQNCMANGPVRFNNEDAIAAWNECKKI